MRSDIFDERHPSSSRGVGIEDTMKVVFYMHITSNQIILYCHGTNLNRKTHYCPDMLRGCDF
ncbi:MAG: hypothetical protein HNEKOMLI_00906 [Sodalis sp. Psp]|nr:hypothetical protein [Sodalis sp. Psp]MCR3757365.1 hypothetical protein [Sodalis sp. Ppy]